MSEKQIHDIANLSEIFFNNRKRIYFGVLSVFMKARGYGNYQYGGRGTAKVISQAEQHFSKKGDARTAHIIASTWLGKHGGYCY